jgi:hypothetical protein
MNFDHRTLLGLTLLLPLALGCASRTAPFNELDEAQTKVLRLQGTEPPPMAAPTQPTPGAPPQLIPGLPIPPELQALGQQAAQAAQQVLPGLIPPGLIPGIAPATPVAPMAPPAPRFPSTVPGQGYVILQERFLAEDGPDKDAKNELLDIFGDEDSFTEERGQCFVPGMGVSFARSNGPPVELLISISCRSAQGAGFNWPHAGKGTFSSDALQKITKIYQQLWGPVPSGA